MDKNVMITNGESQEKLNKPEVTMESPTSSLQSVVLATSEKLDTINNKNPIYFIKNKSGISVPLVFKNSVLLKHNTVDRSVLINNNKLPIKFLNTPLLNQNIVKVEKSTEISPPDTIEKPKKKLVINRKLVNVSTAKKSASTIKQFTLKPPKVPNKKKPKNIRTQPEVKPVENTQNILINNQLVPVDLNTKFQIENGPNIQNKNNDEEVLNIITEKKISTKKSTKFSPKVEKLYQIQVQTEQKNGPKLPVTKNFSNIKDEIELLRGCVQIPMYVENWTQTDLNVTRDSGCQTDVYISPNVDEDCPDIPDLVEYLLDTKNKFTQEMDEITKKKIMNQAQNLRQSEPALITPTVQPPINIKERLFNDLRECLTVDFLGNMRIHNAVLENDLNFLKRQCFALRLRHFNVDVENNYGQTALHLAVINNKNQEIMSTLLENGANVNIKDNLGNSLLHLAVLNTNQQILELILGYCNQVSKFINIKNDEGLTALMIAAIEAKPELIAVLLKFGANPNIRDDKSGRTALFHAVELSNVSAVNILLENKADPKIRNFFGLTSLEVVKDLNASVAALMEKQMTRNNPISLLNSEPSTSPKKRTNKRRTSEQSDIDNKKNKIEVVSKKIKVDVDSLDGKTKTKKCGKKREMKTKTKTKTVKKSYSPTRKKTKEI